MQVAIVGLGVLGTSISLALREAGKGIAIVGHDPDQARGGRAKRLGAVDRTAWDVLHACSDADLVLLDLPPAGVRQALDVLADELREGALVIALGEVLGPLLAYARQTLPPTAGFVGGHLVAPSLLGQGDEPAALHLQGGWFFLVPQAGISGDALDRAADFVVAVGAKPLFTTATEHDGLAAVGSQLPMAVAWALLHVAVTEAGWQDRQHALGGAYAAATALIATDRDGVAEMMVANAEPLGFWLERLSRALGELRGRLMEGDVAQVEALLEVTAEGREQWLSKKAEAPELPNAWRDLLLGRLGRRRS